MAAPYPLSSVITRVSFDWTSHTRLAPGSDNWPMTWAANGHQYTSWGDGGGFGGTNTTGRVGLGAARIEGDRSDYSGININGGVSPESDDDSLNDASSSGKSYGVLAYNGVIYLLVSPGSGNTAFHWARIFHSSDAGLSWTDPAWDFVTQAQGVILPTFLQFGRDYNGGRDGFVYVYGINQKTDDLVIQSPGEIVLARCPKDELLTSASWEWCSNASGPTWSSEIADRVPVFEDTNGVGWSVSANYHAPSSRYLLLTEHSESLVGKIGIFEAPQPWGPWHMVYYLEGVEFFGHDKSTQLEETAFHWVIPNKWVRGRTFTMVFTGTGNGSGNDSWNTVDGTLVGNFITPKFWILT